MTGVEPDSRTGDVRAYHLMELAVARDPSDPRHSLPMIATHHRRILDVGCGAGQTLIASRLSPDVVAVGVDRDHEALILGRGLDASVRLARARGEALPFPSASFDLVLCRVALPYMHVATALREMARVLAPAGDLWLVLHPWTMTAGELLHAGRRFQVKRLVHRTYVLAASVAMHVTGIQLAWRAGGYESFQTVGGMRRALAAAGLVDIRFRRSPAFIATAAKPR